MVRNSIGQSTGLLHRELRVRISPDQQRMNSSMEERPAVNGKAESSNLSSFAKCIRVSAGKMVS